MKIAVTADWHGYLPPTVPDCDLMVVAGDIGLDETFGPGSVSLIRRHLWLKKLPFPVVAIAGNHDFQPAVLRALPWTYLEDEGATINGVKFWGSPWSPNFGYGWAFNKSEEELAEVYAEIPDDTDVLIVHGPPRGSCDRTGTYRGSPARHVGSTALAERMKTLPDLKLVACGHIHPAYGQDGIVVNGSLVNNLYLVTNEPIVVEIDVEQKGD